MAMHYFGPNDAATRLTTIGNNANSIGSQSLMCFRNLVYDTISVASYYREMQSSTNT